MTIIGLDDFVRDFAADVLTDASEEMLEELKDKAPYDQGELVNSAYGPDVDDVDLTATIGFSADQADYTDQGTSPHEIYPRNARALQFFWADGPNGAAVYTLDHVNHPGQAGTGWFTDTIEDDWETQVQNAIERAS